MIPQRLNPLVAFHEPHASFFEFDHTHIDLKGQMENTTPIQISKQEAPQAAPLFSYSYNSGAPVPVHQAHFNYSYTSSELDHGNNTTILSFDESHFLEENKEPKRTLQQQQPPQ